MQPPYGYGTSPPERPGMVTAVAVVMFVLAGLHLLGVGSSMLNMLADHHHASSEGSEAFQSGEKVGRVVGMLASLVWSVAGVVWTPINGWALLTKKPWARMSVIVYSAIAIVTCCCTPFGAFTLYAMLRQDVKDHFAKAP